MLLAHSDICMVKNSHRYYKIRSYLLMLYKEFIELEVGWEWLVIKQVKYNLI